MCWRGVWRKRKLGFERLREFEQPSEKRKHLNRNSVLLLQKPSVYTIVPFHLHKKKLWCLSLNDLTITWIYFLSCNLCARCHSLVSLSFFPPNGGMLRICKTKIWSPPDEAVFSNPELVRMGKNKYSKIHDSWAAAVFLQKVWSVYSSSDF